MSDIFDRVIHLYRGRIDQQQFVFLALCMFGFGFVAWGIITPTVMIFGTPTAFIVTGGLEIVLTVLTMHLYVRRLHDHGASGWYALIVLALAWISLLLGFIAFWVIAVLPQMPTSNQFGSVPPKDRHLWKTFLNT